MKTPGNKLYQIEYLKQIIKEDMPLLPKPIRSTIKKAIEERLMTDPIGFGKPLRFSLRGHRRLRVGDYRIIYRIDAEKKTVILIAIKHRKEIYDP